MKLEVLHIDECPSWDVATERTRAALDQLGFGDVSVTTRLLTEADDLGATAFAGSPTITLDGVDVFPSAGHTTSLACRIYTTDQGLAGVPTTDQIVEAIRSRI